MGGSSKQTIGQRYFAKLTTFIGNPIEKLIGINFDNRGWIFKSDNDESFLRVESPNLYGDKEGGVAGFIDIHTGTADQLPNATYEKDFPKVSGYPFQSYLVFRGLGKKPATSGGIGQFTQGSPKHYNGSFYHGNSGYMKEMLLWPKRTRIRNDGSRQWYEVRDDGAVVCEIGVIVNLKPFWNQPNTSNKLYKTDILRNWIYKYGTAAHETAGEEDREEKDTSLSLYRDNIGTVVASGNLSEGYFSQGTAHYIFGDSGLLKVTGVLLTSSQTESISVDAIGIFDYKEIRVHSEQSSEVNTFFEFYAIVDYDDAGNPPQIFLNVEALGAYGDHTHQMYLQGVKFDFQNKEMGYGESEAFDINPVHKIREILTDDTAMNKPLSDVNDINFMKAADRIWDEGLGISWSVTEKSCLEAINELCGHIEAGVRVNRQTGLYEMVLFRDDWFDENEIHILPVNKIKSMQLNGATSADELINKLNVSYYNRDAIKNSSFSVAENAAIRNLNGHENSDEVKFPYFMNQRNAAVVTQWKLKQMSTPVWQGTLTTGFYEARKWNRYDLLRLEWPRKWAGTILVRIMKINLGTGADVSIDFVEVMPYSGNLSSSIVIDTPVDTTPKPPQPAIFKAFELSYLEAVQLNGQKAVDDDLAYNPDAGYAAVIAKKPQDNSLSALMYTGTGNDFERVGKIAYCETAELDQNISQISTAIIVKDAGDIDMVSTGTQITVNNEIMVYQSYDEQTGLLTVKRGALDTIPQKHLAGSVLYFADDFVTVDPTEYVTGEVIDVKALTTTPSGILDLTEIDAQSIQIKARAIRPYPPANVKINGQYFPVELSNSTITLTWSDRNRTQQTGGEILGWFDSGVSIEEGATYYLNIVAYYSDNTSSILVDQNIGVVNEYLLDVSAQPMRTLFYRIKLATIRNNHECYQPFEFDLMSELLAPINLDAEVFLNG